MNLFDLNARWHDTGKPYAALTPDGKAWRWICPRCERGGHTGLPLFAAMSDALAHKQRCVPVK
jgi:hypothetical protein